MHRAHVLNPFDINFTRALVSNLGCGATWNETTSRRRAWFFVAIADAKRIGAQYWGDAVKSIAVGAFVFLTLNVQPSIAQSFPAACTGSYRFTVSCCKASYGANAEGKVQNATRIAALERCSLNERAAERAAKKKK